MDLPTAAIGWPTNLSDYMEGAPLMWEGKAITANDPADLSPVNLGRDLVELYWQLDANIEEWWDHMLEGCELTPSIACLWAYVGTPLGLVISYWDPEIGDDGAWWVGISSWSEDPATTVFNLHQR